MGGGYSKSEVDTLLNGKADTSHTHTKSQITDFPSYGTTANTICEGNDSRLSDARTPTSHTHTKSEITDFPTLSTVATSGSYNDLSNKPTIPVVDSALSSTSTNALQNKAINTELSKKANTSHTHTVSDVTDFPTLATVATSGSYNDLSNKPTTMTPTSHAHGNITNDGKIGSNANKPLITTTGGTVTTGSFGTSANTFCEGNDSRLSDARTPTAHTHVKSEITDFPSLATVATSGSYNDLSNKPTIPTVNNATLTIQKNGTTVKTFTANASSNVTANITVPTKVSELDNDSNYLTTVPNLDASKITSGTIDIARLPQGALERLVTVTNKTARFALTTSTVQVGDVVKQTDTGIMYYVVDTANLNSEDGYSEFTAGSATSVPWSGVTGKPSSYTPSSHTHGNITNAGAVGTTANKPLITTTNGVITTGSFGTTANTFCQGNDSRLSDARTPTAHTHSASDITSGLATVATSGSYNDLSNKPTIPTVNNATLTIQKNGTTVKTFTANASSNVTANITVPTKTSELTNDSGFITGVTWNDVSNKPTIPVIDSALSSTSTNGLQNKVIKSALDGKANSTHTHSASDITSGTLNTDRIPNLDASKITSGTIDIARLPAGALGALESLSTNSIPFHNAYPRCKYLGTTITDAQNTAIKNRTYDDLFIGDYWTINGVNWRIVAIDYYYNVGDTNFDKGNVIVMPDTVLYDAQMNSTDTTTGAYHGSLMRTQNLNSARTIAQNAFGSHLANHRILLANSVDSSGPNSWAWYDSDGVELPNEVQIYGTRVWGSALKGFDVTTQKQQFPLLALAPQFVNIRQNYWLQDVSSHSVSGLFAIVYGNGYADDSYATYSLGVRPSVTLSYI